MISFRVLQTAQQVALECTRRVYLGGCAVGRPGISSIQRMTKLTQVWRRRQQHKIARAQIGPAT